LAAYAAIANHDDQLAEFRRQVKLRNRKS